ncbi:hypothetical protein [Chromohalobacter sp. 296-RDG]|uniref:hypothetical protein n=1 Tax=Chromohalobacter sp. 296-RDG TaxID=2994062 RepID=UPI0024691DBE|nr:hypothetical protein [Chromohalobacter sp. 296-RDG]
MKYDDNQVDRQDNEIAVHESPEEVSAFKFGYWPEVVGILMTLFIVWMIFQ